MKFEYIEGLTEEQIKELYDDIIELPSDSISVWEGPAGRTYCKKDGRVELCYNYYNLDTHRWQVYCFGRTVEFTWKDNEQIAKTACKEMGAQCWGTTYFPDTGGRYTGFASEITAPHCD